MTVHLPGSEIEIFTVGHRVDSEQVSINVRAVFSRDSPPTLVLRRSTYSPIGPTCRRARPMSGHSQSRFLPARCRHRPPFSRSQSRPVRRSAPTFSRALPTSGPVRWPLSTSSRGLSPPPTRCHREPTRRLRPSRTRTCSPPSSGFPICCGPTRRRLPAKPRVRPCRSGRRRLK